MARHPISLREHLRPSPLAQRVEQAEFRPVLADGRPATLTTQRGTAAQERLPLASLLALAMAAFITILTEALPAGLLPQMAHSLAVSEAWVGQTVTLYAVGSLLAAIPLTASTQGLRRRPLLLAALAGFVVANTVTTFSASYVLTMAARFVAGVSAGLVWALLAGYAARMVPAHQKGRAIAVAMVGTPLALSLGVPAGTYIGNLVGWRMCFGIMSALALVLMVWARIKLPDLQASPPAGRRHCDRSSRCPACARSCSSSWLSYWRITFSIPTSRRFCRRRAWWSGRAWCYCCSASRRCWGSGSLAY